MERDDLRDLDVSRLREGYRDQGELLEDVSTWLDMLLYAYYSRHQWLGPSSDLKDMLGLIVSREEFEHDLAKAAEGGLEDRLTREEREELTLAVQAIRLRIERTARDLPLLQLFQRFQLDSFQRRCVLLSYMGTADRKYEKLFAYLQDDVTQKTPGTALTTQLLCPAGTAPAKLAAAFYRPGPFRSLFDPEQLARGQLQLRETTTEFLTVGEISDRPGRWLYDGARRTPSRPLTVQREIARELDGAFTSGRPCCILLTGAPGSGKRFQVENLLTRQRARCVFVELDGEDWRERAEEAALAANLSGACLCLCHLDRRGVGGEILPPEERMGGELAGLELFDGRRFLLSSGGLCVRSEALCVELALPELDEWERLALFSAELRGAVDTQTLEELAAKFRFTPRQIHTACQQAEGLAALPGGGELSAKLLHQCCYAQAVHRLGELASRVPAAHDWDDVVLPQAQVQLLRQACGHIRYRHQVYGRWGFGEKISYGRGLAILFAGAPGTGKTLCAQVIANQLDMELYKIDLSQIVSKYIGETEKNLRAVFNEARNTSCILFFDECDALFGKRGEVKDAHDRNANLEVAYLLQQLEEHDGVCILATNLIGNIDEAFMRRITYVVRFPFPDAAMREEIYRRMFPPQAPLDEDVDWAFLAEKFQLSGGHIRNIVLAAAFLAAGERRPIGMRHLLLSAVNEMKKNDIVVVREQLQEYADLLEDGNGGML